DYAESKTLRHESDDTFWKRKNPHFSEPELVELGYWIGFTFGGQRWLKTLGTKQGELEAFLKERRANRK
ncbi:MAG: hypothetical protein ACREUP_04420, partial [Burkholderiales bacterium]